MQHPAAQHVTSHHVISRHVTSHHVTRHGMSHRVAKITTNGGKRGSSRRVYKPAHSSIKRSSSGELERLPWLPFRTHLSGRGHGHWAYFTAFLAPSEYNTNSTGFFPYCTVVCPSQSRPRLYKYQNIVQK